MELMARKQCKKTPNWKASGRDDVQGFWIKKLDTMRGRIARQLNYILNGTARLPKWTTYGRSVLCEKDPTNGSAADNYLTIILRNRAEYHLILSRRGRRPSWLNQGIFRKIEQDNCVIIQQILIGYNIKNEKNYGCMMKTLKASNT